MSTATPGEPTNLALDERLSVWRTSLNEPVLYRGRRVSHRRYNGLGLFGWMRAAVARLLSRRRPVFPVAAAASVEPVPRDNDSRYKSRAPLLIHDHAEGLVE